MKNLIECGHICVLLIWWIVKFAAGLALVSVVAVLVAPVYLPSLAVWLLWMAGYAVCLVIVPLHRRRHRIWDAGVHCVAWAGTAAERRLMRAFWRSPRWLQNWLQEPGAPSYLPARAPSYLPERAPRPTAADLAISLGICLLGFCTWGAFGLLLDALGLCK